MRTDKDEWRSREGICCVFYDIGADGVLSEYRTHYPKTKKPCTRGNYILKRTIRTVIEGVRGCGYRLYDSAK